MYYVNIFFIFSLIGHITENIVYSKVDSGILYGLWTPIYGIGVIFIILINNFLNSFKLNFLLKLILLFFLSGVVLAIIETFGGYFIEIIYGRIFWNYNNHFVPIGKYTSLQMMGLWGLSSILVIYLIIPVINKIIKKIPDYLTFSLIGIFLFDFIYSYYKIGNFIERFL